MKRKIFREDILKTGLDLMFDYGYHATGIKQITDTIEIPKGSFYNHFDSKEAFGLEVLQRYCDNGLLLHKRALAVSEVPPLKRLENMYDKIIHNYSDHLDYKKGCVMSNFSAEMADINEKFRAILDAEFFAIQNEIETVLLEAKDTGDLNNSLGVRETASFILNSWHGALIRMKSTANNVPLLQFKNFIFNQLLS